MGRQTTAGRPPSAMPAPTLLRHRGTTIPPAACPRGSPPSTCVWWTQGTVWSAPATCSAPARHPYGRTPSTAYPTTPSCRGFPTDRRWQSPRRRRVPQCAVSPRPWTQTTRCPYSSPSGGGRRRPAPQTAPAAARRRVHAERPNTRHPIRPQRQVCLPHPRRRGGSDVPLARPPAVARERIHTA